ncbi:hypothetical protein QC761_000560 [Podospora bellae-mahoneyi]|uniref:Mid2 domain-containing protein n=1 Tax=Podospora bellae-mahoneyi TaxID=2093777 RepID=A0ABR0FN61_9PEZI|nr:hypothetical protein QC761_000560 [Podospora bellae-mahoneyi]
MRTLLALALLSAQAVGQNGHNDVWFIYPTESHTYQHMDTINVTYESPFPTPTLFGWCDGGGRNFYDQRVPGYNASVAVVLNFTSGTPCWFNLRPGRVAGFGANSPSFNLLGVERPSGGIVHGPDTSGSDRTPPEFPTTSATTSPTPTTAAPTESHVLDDSNVSPGEQHEPTSTTTPNPEPPDEKLRGDSGGLGGGQSAGIVVGAIVGVLAIAAGLFFWWKRRSRRADSGEQIPQHDGSHHSHCQHHSDQALSWQHEAGAASPWSQSPAAYVNGHQYNGACTCMCPTRGQPQVKRWPVEVSSTNSPSELSSSDLAWASKPKYEMPA